MMSSITYHDLAFRSIPVVDQKNEMIIFPKLNAHIKKYELLKKTVIGCSLGATLFIALTIIFGVLSSQNIFFTIGLGSASGGLVLTGSATLVYSILFIPEINDPRLKNRFKNISQTSEYEDFLKNELVNLNREKTNCNLQQYKTFVELRQEVVEDLQNKIKTLENIINPTLNDQISLLSCQQQLVKDNSELVCRNKLYQARLIETQKIEIRIKYITSLLNPDSQDLK